MPYDETRGVEQPDTDEPATPRTVRAIAEAGLPFLTGSPSDVETAANIRAAKLIAADDLLSTLRGNEALTEEHSLAAIPPPHITHAQVQQAQAALNRLRHQTEAGWWIAHESHSAQSLLDACATNIAPDSSPTPQPGGATTYSTE